MVEGGQQGAGGMVVGAAFNADRALAHRRKHLVEGQRDGLGRLGHGEAVQSGHGEQGCVDLAGFELPEPGLHIAANQHDVQIGAPHEKLGLAAQRGAADDRPSAELVDGARVPGDQRIARVFAGQLADDGQAVGQPGRHVLHGMDRHVDGAALEGGLDFLGEHPLAADFGQRSVAHPIAGGDDDLDGEPLGDMGMGGGEGVFHGFRLDQGERRAARADENF